MLVTSDGAWADAGLGRLVDALAEGCGGLDVALAEAPGDAPLREHRLSERVRVTLLPRMPSLARGFSKAAACRSVIRSLEQRCDALVVQLPFAAPAALASARTPRLYQVCADVLAQSRSAANYAGVKRAPARLVGRLLDRWQAGLVRRSDSRVVTHGERLLERYRGRGRAVVSSALLASEIGTARRTRPTGAPFRVLFVGYLRHEKGLDTLLDAFDGLRARHPDAELEIVGGTDLVDTGIERRLRTATESRGGVTLRGALPFGPELFQTFAEADVLALPSLSEGTPRVLVEARAFGCPVVASRVGGIPTSVDDGVDGLLCEAGSASELEHQLDRLAQDDELRARLVAAGYERARRTTVETFAGALLDELATLVADSVPENAAVSTASGGPE